MGGENNPDPEIPVIVQEGELLSIGSPAQDYRCAWASKIYIYIFFQMCVGRTGPIIVLPDDDDKASMGIERGEQLIN